MYPGSIYLNSFIKNLAIKLPIAFNEGLGLNMARGLFFISYLCISLVFEKKSIVIYMVLVSKNCWNPWV